MGAPAEAVLGWTVKNRALAAAGVTITVAVSVIAAALMLAEIVFDSAVVELKVAVKTPLGSVVPEAGVNTFPVPVDASVTDAPATGSPAPLRAVTVIVTLFEPLLAITVPAEAATVDCDPETPPVTFTVAV
jgi:hypothetical protein